MKKVRYMTVPRVAIEVVSKLTTEEKGQFIDFLYSAFKQVEKGEQVTIPECDGIMEFAIEETVTELMTGYANYRQKMTAVEVAKEKKRKKELKEMGIDPDEIADTSANNQRSIGDTSAKGIRLNQKDQIEKTLPYQRDDRGRDTGNPADRNFIPEDKDTAEAYWFQITVWLNNLGIPFVKYDADIMKAWKENGIDAIRTVWNQLREQKKTITKEAFVSLVYEEGKRQ